MSMVGGHPGPNNRGDWTELGNGEGCWIAKPEDQMGSLECLQYHAHLNVPAAVARLYRERECRHYGWNPSVDPDPTDADRNRIWEAYLGSRLEQREHAAK